MSGRSTSKRLLGASPGTWPGQARGQSSRTAAAAGLSADMHHHACQAAGGCEWPFLSSPCLAVIPYPTCVSANPLEAPAGISHAKFSLSFATLCADNRGCQGSHACLRSCLGKHQEGKVHMYMAVCFAIRPGERLYTGKAPWRQKASRNVQPLKGMGRACNIMMTGRQQPRNR